MLSGDANDDSERACDGHMETKLKPRPKSGVQEYQGRNQMHPNMVHTHQLEQGQKPFFCKGPGVVFRLCVSFYSLSIPQRL